MNAVFLLSTASVVSVAIPISLGIYGYPRLRIEMKLLMILFLFAAAVDGYTFYTFYHTLHKAQYQWAHHLYTPIEFGLLALVFSYWQPRRWLQNVMRVSIPVFAFVCVIILLSEGNVNDLSEIAQALACMLYVPISLSILYDMQRLDPEGIFRDFRFWIASGLLLYSAGSLAYFALHSLIARHHLVQVWFIYGTLNVVANILYGVGFLCQYRHPKPCGA
jgi:hypothetical protein